MSHLPRPCTGVFAFYPPAINDMTVLAFNPATARPSNPATARPTNVIRPTRVRTARPASLLDARNTRGRKVGGNVRSHIIGNCAPNKPVESLYQTGVIWTTV